MFMILTKYLQCLAPKIYGSFEQFNISVLSWILTYFIYPCLARSTKLMINSLRILFNIDETLKGKKKLKKTTNKNNNYNFLITKYMNKFYNKFSLGYYRFRFVDILTDIRISSSP